MCQYHIYNLINFESIDKQWKNQYFVIPSKVLFVRKMKYSCEIFLPTNINRGFKIYITFNPTT